VEHEEQADELERAAEDMEDRSERVGDHIQETRREWEAKEEDPAVPGAQTPRRSDQLPEDGPAEAVPDDGGDESTDDETKDSPGVPGEDETATGNPGAAGADEG
jgi:hypothetical protein